jgi:hypothetical protein
MYKFSNPEHTKVTNILTNTYEISPSSWLWEEYQNWVDEGGVTLPYRTPEEAQLEVKTEIKNTAISKRYSGILIGTYWLPTDPDSRIEYIILKDLARDLYESGYGIDTPIIVDGDEVELESMDGVFVVATIRKVKILIKTLQALDRRLRRVAKYHIAQMLLAENPLQYDYSTGWPPSYPG